MFGQIVKDWAHNEWPDLNIAIDHEDTWVRVNAYDGEKVWTIANIYPDRLSYRRITIDRWEHGRFVLAEPLTASQQYAAVWGDSDLSISDPDYFNKLKAIIVSALIHTQQTIKHWREQCPTIADKPWQEGH